MESPPKSPLSLRDVKKSGDARPLESRVQSLKIAKSDRLQEQSSSSRFAWIVSLVLAILCAWMVYRDDNLMAMVGIRKIEPSNSIAKVAGLESNSGSTPKSGEPSNRDVPVGTKTSLLANDMALESRGYVIAKHQVLVSPQVSGRIMRLNIEEGRRVTKGDILAEVDPTEYLADLKQLQGALLKSKAELAELETGARPQEIESATVELTEQEEILPQFKSEYERLSGLFKANAVSATEFDQARSNYLGARRRIERLTVLLDMLKEGPRKERIEVARAAVMQAEASLAKSQWRLDPKEECGRRKPRKPCGVQWFVQCLRHCRLVRS